MNFVLISSSGVSDPRLSGHSAGSFRDVERFLSAKIHLPPRSVVVIDVPGPFPEILDAIFHRYPWISIIVLTDESNPALSDGDYFSFVGSNRTEVELVDEMHRLAKASEKRQLVEQHRRYCVDHIELLSTREREVLGYLVAGLESKEIAQLLGIRCSTVDKHRRSIHAKLGTSNSVELANFVNSLPDVQSIETAHLSTEQHALAIIDVIGGNCVGI